MNASQNALVLKTDKKIAAIQHERFLDAFTRISAGRINVQRFIEVVGLNLKTNPSLADCTTESLMFACMDAGRRGLEPTGLTGGGWLIPRWRKFKDEQGSWQRVREATFMSSYFGDLKEIRRSCKTERVVTEVVFRSDKFEWEPTNLDRPIFHRPDLESDDRGELFAAYCILRLEDGSVYTHVVTSNDIKRAMDASESADNEYSPWKKHPEAMWMKTAVRRACKLVPREDVLFGDDADDLGARARVIEVQTEARAVANNLEARERAQITETTPIDPEQFAVAAPPSEGTFRKSDLIKYVQQLKISRKDRDALILSAFNCGIDDLTPEQLDEARIEIETFAANQGAEQ